MSAALVDVIRLWGLSWGGACVCEREMCKTKQRKKLNQQGRDEELKNKQKREGQTLINLSHGGIQQGRTVQ